MANSFLSNIFLLTVVATNFMFISNVHGHYTGLFVFGDSFYDTGNSKYLPTAAMRADIIPYGVTFFKKPTGRFCDGRLIPDFIAQRAKQPFPAPFLQPGVTSYKEGIAFACAGSGALNETFQGRAINLPLQLENFKKAVAKLILRYGHGNTRKILSKGVYIINIGTNDYLYALQTDPTALTPQYVNMVVGNITKAIQVIHGFGGRKFVINNVGPLGCFPIVKAALNFNGTCVPQVNQIVSLHNLMLSQALAALSTQFPNLKYGLFDMFTNLMKRITNPATYGLEVTESACCGSGPYRGLFSCGGQGNLTTYLLCTNPTQRLFWDSIHPSDTANNQLANLMWAGTQPDIGPLNVKTLFRL